MIHDAIFKKPKHYKLKADTGFFFQDMMNHPEFENMQEADHDCHLEPNFGEGHCEHNSHKEI